MKIKKIFQYLKISVIILTFFGVVNLSYSQVYTHWVSKHYSNLNYGSLNPIMALDNSENVYISGDINKNPTNNDIITIKYDSTGNEVWERTYSSIGNYIDHVYDNTLDKNGNIIVTGYIGSINANLDVITIKYNSNGDSIWARSYNSPGNGSENGFKVIVDDSDNVYVAGKSNGFGTGNEDFLLLKYNSSGELIWERTYNGTGNGLDYSNNILIDKYGYIYIVGSSTGLTSNYDIVTIKYDSFGTQKWIKRFNGSGNGIDKPTAIGIDDSGDVIISGNSVGLITSNIVILKYDKNGSEKWHSRFDSNFVSTSSAFDIDRYGNIYICGSSRDIYFQEIQVYSAIKFNYDGILQWVYKDLHDYGNAFSINVDSIGNSYVTGYELFGAYAALYTTSKINSIGLLNWTIRDGGLPLNSSGTSLNINTIGRNIYITGYEETEVGSSVLNFFTVKYSAYPPPPNLKITLAFEGLYFPLLNQMLRNDSVEVFLRNNNPPFEFIDSAKGVIDSLNFSGNFKFNWNNLGNYYIVVKHLNSIETWSYLNVNINNLDTNYYDFTTSISKAYGNNMVLKGGKYCLFSGDVNQDGFISLTDLILIYNSSQSFTTGRFIPSDLNGDSIVDLTDVNLCYNNSIKFIVVIRP